MSLVLVRIQYERSNKEVIPFAMLHACSQGTFLTNKLMKHLGIEGTRTINIKTLNGQERQSAHILDGIKVCKHQKQINIRNGSNYRQHIQKRKYLWT